MEESFYKEKVGDGRWVDEKTLREMGDWIGFNPGDERLTPFNPFLVY